METTYYPNGIIRLGCSNGAAEMPASYPLWTIQGKTAPEWAIDLLADLYAAEIKGSHGMGIAHPRASWLTLLVSSCEECVRCGSPDVRWEDAEDGAFCRPCAEAEIVALGARAGARIHALARAVDEACPRAVDEVETTPIPHVPMAVLVFGGR